MSSGLPFGNGTLSLGGVELELGSLLNAARSLAGKLSVLVIAPSIACFLWFWVAYQTSPLRKYPGPFLAGMFVFCVSEMTRRCHAGPSLLTTHMSDNSQG